MDISRNNYMVYCMDYMDGKLPAGEMSKFMLFLKQNPDLAEELEDLKTCILEPANVKYPEKDRLKKAAYPFFELSEFDYLCIKMVEQEITLEEKAKLEDLLQKDQQKKRDFSLYLKTILKPNNKIVFLQKSSLKRNPILKTRQPMLKIFMGMAAGLALLIGIYSTIKLIKVGNHQPFVTEEIETITFDNQTQSPMSVQSNNLIRVVDNNSRQRLSETKHTVATELMAVHDSTPAEREQIAFSIIEPLGLNKLHLPQPQLIINDLDIITMNGKPDWELLAEESTGTYLSSGKTRTIGAFELAQLGLKKLSNYTGYPIELNADKDNEGTLKNIRFESGHFAFSTTIKKKGQEVL